MKETQYLTPYGSFDRGSLSPSVLRRLNIAGYDNNNNTWITYDPYGDKNQANYGKQGLTVGRAVEYGQNTNGIGDRRIYWMEDKK
ncbi:hypothetical protein [Leptospira borgpetersenii]|uniref:hypothetical protein n=1 Tax=Leptospira borgpetersenii TaxID=174 RepID=UPI0003497372|nr:hypothetical protein [Leptospira borgpetersenii]URD69698.1 hypothetical protein LIX26_13925 [Leptospira borgpetersenii]UVD72874.1 hypothetical protein NU962_13995 [Leptospira borgpetersenii]UVD76068.1 hypothetical protein LIX27_14055 [Leptospira borgpetersenii]UZW32626.1 hypothetical protein OR565_14060 [Leptospira borgpetersenii]